MTTTSKKDKKKKKNFWEADPEPVVVPEPEPVKEEPKADDDLWGGFGLSAKDKKKAKKAAKAGGKEEEKEDPIVVVPEPVAEEKPDEMDAWMSTSKKVSTIVIMILGMRASRQSRYTNAASIG